MTEKAALFEYYGWKLWFPKSAVVYDDYGFYVSAWAIEDAKDWVAQHLVAEPADRAVFDSYQSQTDSDQGHKPNNIEEYEKMTLTKKGTVGKLWTVYVSLRQGGNGETIYPEGTRDYKTDSVKRYAYISETHLDPGDIVVVYLPNGICACAEVTQCRNGVGPNATKYIVQKVDMTAYFKREEDRVKREEILRQLEEREKASDSKLRWERLAAVDPIAANLLGELEALELEEPDAEVPNTGN